MGINLSYFKRDIYQDMIKWKENLKWKKTSLEI